MVGSRSRDKRGPAEGSFCAMQANKIAAAAASNETIGVTTPED